MMKRLPLSILLAVVVLLTSGCGWIVCKAQRSFDCTGDLTDVLFP
jgi:outer membrane lipopolysaccharide assembly protein LptE/RlpB